MDQIAAEVSPNGRIVCAAVRGATVSGGNVSLTRKGRFSRMFARRGSSLALRSVWKGNSFPRKKNQEDIVAYSIPLEVRIAFFDMDHTLIDNDCDLSWKLFLADRGLADWRDRMLGRWHYFRYRMGRLNTESFTQFQLEQFRGKTDDEMRLLLDEHFRLYVLPRVYPAVFPLMNELALRRIPRVLVTATNAEIARPLADHFEMDALLATQLERDAAGRFTGRITGTYCLGAQKIPLMEAEAARRASTLADAMYWGDSGLDIPILAAVGHPIAANPAPKLRSEAKKRGWPVVNFSRP